jgi:hypothetical protein
MTDFKGKGKIPVISVTNPNLSGSIGDVLETPFSISSPHTIVQIVISGRDSVLFGLITAASAPVGVPNDSVRLLDSATPGTYICFVTATDEDGRDSAPVQISAVVAPGTSLPALVLTTSALDAHTVQCAFTSNAAYASYQFAINLDYGTPLNLAANKQIPIVQSGQDYDVQVRGTTSGGGQGPWSNISTVSLPFATLELIAVTIDADTVELQFSDDATYVRYQAQLKIGAGAYGAPIDLDGTKRVNGLIASTTYTAEVRGSTT